jgi:hypothetical protein
LPFVATTAGAGTFSVGLVVPILYLLPVALAYGI